MWLPLAILAVPTVLLGFWSINSGFADFLTGTAYPLCESLQPNR